MSERHLVVMAAGTGGHVIPGLAVAEEMQRRGWTVSWIGTPQGMENRLVPARGIEIDALPFAGLRGKGLGHTLRGIVGFFKSLGQAKRVYDKRRATAVLGMGGYVCVPAGMTAALSGRPLMLVNADAAMLKSNLALKPFARRIAFGFDGAAAASTAGAVVSGNPVRAEIEALAAPAERFADRAGPLRLLVLGGSLGARALNQALPQTLALWPEGQRPQVLHQSGPEPSRRGLASLHRRRPCRPRCALSSTTWPRHSPGPMSSSAAPVPSRSANFARPVAPRCWCRWWSAPPRTSATTPSSWPSMVRPSICRKPS